MSTTLIRTVHGRETPGPGRWVIAPGYPVQYRTGHWWRAISGTLRTVTGHLLVPDSAGLSFQITLDTREMALAGRDVLRYQSLAIDASSVSGSWPVDGELFTADRIVPARSVLHYHGVFRTGAAAVARIGWQLRVPAWQRRDGRQGGPLSVTADLNAEAPPVLLENMARP
jgi:hypothetical protein